jgi:hypothetical protein
MSLRLKLFAVACAICAVARLAEYCFQQNPAQPVVAKSAETQGSAPVEAIAINNYPPLERLPNSTDIALAPGRQLLASDPSDDKGRAGDYLLSLCNAGQFQQALQFANQAPPDLKSGWLKAVFTRWGQVQPREAIAALASLEDESERTSLFHGITDAWAANDPSALAKYAGSLPDGDDKTYALNQVVDNWSLQDPEAFSGWLNSSPTGVKLDTAIEQMISKTDEANRTSEVAMQWVDCINDPALRYGALLQVLGQWNQSNPTAAQKYVSTVSWLNDSQRRKILNDLQSPPLAVASGSDD